MGIFHQLIKPGPPGPGTRDLIDVFFEDGEPTLLDQLNEVITLGLRMLVQAARHVSTGPPASRPHLYSDGCQPTTNQLLLSDQGTYFVHIVGSSEQFMI